MEVLENFYNNPVVDETKYDINFSNCNHKEKYFIITYGPPASGKGITKNKIIEYLDIETYIDIDIDKFIKSYCIRNKFTKDCNNMGQTVYFDIRKIVDNVSDQLLAKAAKKNCHIIWETTGNSIEWTMKVYIPFMKSIGYTIVINFPIVKIDELVRRCKNRQQEANCDIKYIGSFQKNSYKNFYEIIKKCDMIFVYDNNNGLKLIYARSIKNNVGTLKKLKTFISKNLRTSRKSFNFIRRYSR